MADGIFQAAQNKTLEIAAVGMTLADFNGDRVRDLSAHTTGTVNSYLQDRSTTTTLQGLILNSVQDARDTMLLLDALLTRLANQVGDIGSIQSRLITAFDTLGASREISLLAEGRIVNVDIAGESA